MHKIRLSITISNAADRSKDATYILDCKLPGIPSVGDTINLGRWRPKVDGVEWYPGGEPYPTIRLAADHQSFKGADFGSLCRKWESVGFRADP